MINPSIHFRPPTGTDCLAGNLLNKRTSCADYISPCANRMNSDTYIYDIKRIICISDRYSIEVYNLETIATLAFRIESFGAAKVRKVLLERIMHGRKEKTTVFVSVVSDGKPNSRWKA